MMQNAGYKSSFVGFFYFLGKPRFWLIPLTAMLLSWIGLFSIFIIISYQVWPDHALPYLKYTLGIFEALGIASLVVLVIWLTVFPFILSCSFELLLKEVALSKGDVIQPLPWLKALKATVHVVVKTLGIRCFWIAITIVMCLIFSPLSFIVSNIGMMHIALIDGCDLSLALRGMEAKTRLLNLKKYRLPILAGGVVAGVISTVLIPTVLIWLFWIPGIYVGAYLWAREWS